MKFTAVGDTIVLKKMNKEYTGFDKISSHIKRGDARYFNLETTVNDEGECFASQFCGGTHLRTSKKNFREILNFGFNMVSFNNNHTFDYSYDGMYKTYEAVEENGKLKYLELLPIKLCIKGNKSDNGLPFVAEDDSFMERLKHLSKPFGVDIVKEDNKYICKW